MQILFRIFGVQILVIAAFGLLLLAGCGGSSPTSSQPQGGSQQTNRLYVANSGSNTVSVIDTTTNTIIATFNVNTFPVRIVVDHTLNRAYTTDTQGNSVSVTDTVTYTRVRTSNNTTEHQLGFTPLGIAIHPSTHKVYVGLQDPNYQRIAIIDPANNSFTLGALGNSSDGMGQSLVFNSNILYFAAYNGAGYNGVRIYDFNSGAANSVSLLNTPQDIAINPNINRAYVTLPGSNSVSVIDTINRTVVTNIAVGTAPIGVAVNTALNRAYVANSGSNTVSVIDSTNNTIVTNVPVGSNPRYIAVDTASNKAYVTNNTSNTVSVIDLLTNTVVATISVGTAPSGITL